MVMKKLNFLKRKRKYHLPPLLFKPIVWVTIPKHKRKYLWHLFNKHYTQFQTTYTFHQNIVRMNNQVKPF